MRSNLKSLHRLYMYSRDSIAEPGGITSAFEVTDQPDEHMPGKLRICTFCTSVRCFTLSNALEKSTENNATYSLCCRSTTHFSDPHRFVMIPFSLRFTFILSAIL